MRALSGLREIAQLIGLEAMAERTNVEASSTHVEPVTVHLIFNAHIDPVWLWPWEAGMDEVIATCRSACDRLDNHPDLIFTRGEAWAYEIVERLDPALFRRIQRHIADRRWEIVGGWWIQPDCNLPSGDGMRKQIELGKAYFESRFGHFPRIAYNVDSFGHAAALPRLMRAYGQDRYIMMRPQEHELPLPARLFRWRGDAADPEVTAFRIAGNYEISKITVEHIRASLENLPDGVLHTMCFVGVGDHGGGPTERQIEWCRQHKSAIPGCRLVFSSPSRFFDAVQGNDFPLIIGELQHHAVGCYSVMRSIKLGVRDAEHKLQQAEIISTLDPNPPDDMAKSLERAWRYVCFNHFHDTLGGTCIPSAYPQLEDQLGAAKTIADEIVQFGFRCQLVNLPDDSRQRIVLLNASDAPFQGYVTLAPWTEEMWQPGWRLVDSMGADVPHQVIEQEALARHTSRILLHTTLEAGELKSLLLERSLASENAKLAVSTAENNSANLSTGSVGVDFSNSPTIRLRDFAITPDFVSIEDATGTWAHGVDRFGDVANSRAAWDAPVAVHGGPLMWSSAQAGRLEQSDLSANWRVFSGEEIVRLSLRVHWHALHRIFKFVLPFSEDIESRVDGVLDGSLERGQERRERPISDFCLVRLKSGLQVGIVCTDVFALDADARQLRFTLLRSPFLAHHHPSHPATPARAIPADQGLHEFRFEFLTGTSIATRFLHERALAYHRPPLSGDWTKGMLARSSL
jgi:alpha-mannosidase